MVEAKELEEQSWRDVKVTGLSQESLVRLTMFQEALVKGVLCSRHWARCWVEGGRSGADARGDETHNALKSGPSAHECQTRTCNNRSQCVLQSSFQGWEGGRPRNPRSSTTLDLHFS